MHVTEPSKLVLSLKCSVSWKNYLATSDLTIKTVNAPTIMADNQILSRTLQRLSQANNGRKKKQENTELIIL